MPKFDPVNPLGEYDIAANTIPSPAKLKEVRDLLNADAKEIVETRRKSDAEENAAPGIPVSDADKKFALELTTEIFQGSDFDSLTAGQLVAIRENFHHAAKVCTDIINRTATAVTSVKKLDQSVEIAEWVAKRDTVNQFFKFLVTTGQVNPKAAGFADDWGTNEKSTTLAWAKPNVGAGESSVGRPYIGAEYKFEMLLEGPNEDGTAGVWNEITGNPIEVFNYIYPNIVTRPRYNGWKDDIFSTLNQEKGADSRVFTLNGNQIRVSTRKAVK